MSSSVEDTRRYRWSAPCGARASFSVELTLQWDPEGRRPALRRIGGCNFSHRGESLPDAIAAEVIALGEELGDAPTAAELDPVHTLDELEGLLESSSLRRVPGSKFERLVVDRGRPGRAPRWPASVRSGEPRAGSLWPFDAELAGLRLGRRRVVKRECHGADELRRDRSWLMSQGVRVAALELSEGSSSLFGALEETALAEALELERRLRAREEGEDIQRMGELLGYPACCRRAVAALPRRGDLDLFGALLPTAGASPVPPTGGWLTPLSLVSHAPCSLRCPATHELGTSLLNSLGETIAGFRERWWSLARSIHVVTPEGAWLIDAVDGGDGRPKVRRAWLLRPRAFASPTDDPLEPHPELAGRHDSVVELVAALGAEPLAFADHRAGAF